MSTSPWIRQSVVAATVAIALLAGSPDALGWQSEIDGGGLDSSYDLGNDVAVDTAGDVYFAGGIAAPLVNSAGNQLDDLRFAVIKFGADSGAILWRAEINGPQRGDVAWALAIGSDGDPVAAGEFHPGPDQHDMFIAKFSAATGEELWRTSLTGTSSLESIDLAQAIALDQSDDVVVSGVLQNSGYVLDFSVAKLDGATGTELWRTSISGPSHGRASTVALDSAGDVLAAGFLSDSFGVVKFSGATGAEIWRGASGGSDWAESVAVDPFGDVIVAGRSNTAGAQSFVVVKLAGDTGVELWRYTRPPSGLWDKASSVTVDGIGDVYAAGRLAQVFTTVRLSGSTGAELWRASSGSGWALSVALDGSGNVISAGRFGELYEELFGVVKLAAASGSESWRAELDSVQHWGSAKAVVVDQADDIVAGGVLGNADADIVAVKLSGVTGESTPSLLSGRRLVLRDHTEKLTRRRCTVVAKNLAYPIPTPGSPADPTLNGATLTVRNPTTREGSPMSLPASGWTALPNGRGYKYLDVDQLMGPCKRVFVRGPVLKAVCVGEQLSFTLDEPSQGELDAELKLGQGGQAATYEMTFGGTILVDRPNDGSKSGLFKAKDAPAPSP